MKKVFFRDFGQTQISEQSLARPPAASAHGIAKSPSGCYTGLIKNFREAVTVSAQTIQMEHRPCRVYGEVHAEYLLLQMTDAHELQSMDSEVAAIAQSSHKST